MQISLLCTNSSVAPRPKWTNRLVMRSTWLEGGAGGSHLPHPASRHFLPFAAHCQWPRFCLRSRRRRWWWRWWWWLLFIKCRREHKIKGKFIFIALHFLLVSLSVCLCLCCVSGFALSSFTVCCFYIFVQLYQDASVWSPLQQLTSTSTSFWFV